MAKPEPGKAVYSIFTSPHHAPQPDHLPTLMVTPAGKPHHVLYIYLHTNYNQEEYLLTPSDAGDLCVAKLFPPPYESTSSGSSSGHGGNGGKSVRCEASRNLRWSIVNTGVAMPTYKITLPNPDGVGDDQPLFQISKTNRMSPYWTMTYYTYAGHLIPPKRVEFGRIEKTSTDKGGDGGTRVIITGKTDAEKAVWKTLGDGNEDMVEWCVLCGALNVLDDEIREAARAAGHPIKPPPSASQPSSSQKDRDPRKHRQLHPTGRSIDGALAGLRIVDAHRPSSATPNGNAPRPPGPKKSPSFDSRPVPTPHQQQQQPQQGSYRSASPYRAPPSPRLGPPNGQMGRPPPNDGYYQQQGPPPSMGDPRRPERSQPPPTMARPMPQPPMRGGSGDSRADPRYGSSPSGGSYRNDDPRRDPRSNGSYDPRSDPRMNGSHHDPRPDLRANGSYDSRSDPRHIGRAASPAGRPGPQPDGRVPTAASSSSRAPPPATLRTNNGPPAPSMSSSRLPPTPGTASTGSSKPSPSSPPRGPPTGRERTLTSGQSAPTSRGHERTGSLDAAARSTARSQQPSPIPGENRRPAGREAVTTTYTPGARRFGNEPLSPTVPPSPSFAPSTPSRGVQLQDVPASRATEGLQPVAGHQSGDGSSTAFSATEKIKQQRLARMRQASSGS